MSGVRSISERLSKLPPGGNLPPAEFVSENQRARILHAVSDLVAERGYQKTTIELIARSARVALGTFYEHFASKEKCFIATFEADVETAREIFGELLDPGLEWTEQIATGLEILVELVVAEPNRAKVCFIASQSAGSGAFARYQATLDEIAPTLRRGRSINPYSTRLPDGLEVALAGGIAWLVHQRLLNDELDELRGLLPEMIQLTLTPYVGEGEAHRIARKAGMRERVVLPDLPESRAREV
jgi:AcrR family transcriptional regulator